MRSDADCPPAARTDAPPTPRRWGLEPLEARLLLSADPVLGALQAGGPRGRPLGARRGELRAGARLDLIATLRAAAPWQRLRQAAAPGPARLRHRCLGPR